eukprot:EG_transcript_13600
MTVMAWVGALLHPHCVWRPSVHHHHMFRFYRFVDDKVEAQYAHRSNYMWRAILRSYCLVICAFAIQEFVSYPGPLTAPPFWALFGICMTSFLMLLASYWRGMLPFVLPMHTLSLCAFGGVYMYHLRMISSGFEEIAMTHIFAAAPASAGDAALYSRAEEMVHLLVGQVVQREGLLNCCVLWVSLCVAGFNAWTVVAYTVLFVSSIIGMCANPMIEDKGISMFPFVVCTLASGMVSMAMERVRRSDFLVQTQLARELQASQLADSVLNHMLKNVLADVAANIEIFLAGELGPEVLEDAVVCLRRGIQSCRARMVYLKMVAGDYVPVLNAINLKEFGQQLVAGRCVATRFLDFTVLMDGTLMQLILENALSNAFKHGHPDLPGVQLIIREERPPPGNDILCGRQRVSFTVRNVAHPLKPKLTE